jgi:metal-responsive CopG/Arc/MetJ family transcriptional regulator
MPRPSINGTRIHVIIPDDDLAGLHRIADKTGLTVSELIRAAVHEHVERYPTLTKKDSARAKSRS